MLSPTPIMQILPTLSSEKIENFSEKERTKEREMYILGLEEAWSRISWECGKWETQTPTYGYYSLCCTPEYYTYLAWIEQFYSKLLVWLTDWLGMLRFVMDRRTRRALRLFSPLGTHTCYHSIHLTQISPLINLMKTISINCVHSLQRKGWDIVLLTAW